MFNPGSTINLGAGNVLTNQGTLSPGGSGVIQTTALTGNLVQTSTGVFVVDLGATTADRINVTGTAVLAGTVLVNLLASPTVDKFTILSATGGVTDNGLTLTSPAINAFLTFPDANDVVLDLNLNFVVAGLNPNQTAIAEYANAAFQAGMGGLGPLLTALANLPTLDAYKAALDQLSPEIYSEAEIAALYSNLAFANSLLSCKVNGTDRRDHPRGPMRMGGRLRCLPRPRHHIEPDRLQGHDRLVRGGCPGRARQCLAARLCRRLPDELARHGDERDERWLARTRRRSTQIQSRCVAAGRHLEWRRRPIRHQAADPSSLGLVPRSLISNDRVRKRCGNCWSLFLPRHRLEDIAAQYSTAVLAQ